MAAGYSTGTRSGRQRRRGRYPISARVDPRLFPGLVVCMPMNLGNGRVDSPQALVSRETPPPADSDFWSGRRLGESGGASALLCRNCCIGTVPTPMKRALARIPVAQPILGFRKDRREWSSASGAGMHDARRGCTRPSLMGRPSMHNWRRLRSGRAALDLRHSGESHWRRGLAL
jgi:hypothetical protein